MHMKMILGLDIGGTHISGGLISNRSGELETEGFGQHDVDAQADAETVLAAWVDAINSVAGKRPVAQLDGIGIAMPGPFDYRQGISLIRGLGKYDVLYGMNIRAELKKRLRLPGSFPILFQNDAICFAMGEQHFGQGEGKGRLVGLTLGTGLGAAFLRHGKPVTEGPCVPPGGTLYNVPYRGGIAEDYFSARGLIKQYQQRSNTEVNEASQIYDRALLDDREARATFSHFGKELAQFLSPWLHSFGAQTLVIGGGITKSASFFAKEVEAALKENGLETTVSISTSGERASALGAAGLLVSEAAGLAESNKWRRTNQYLLPETIQETDQDHYSIYPSFHLEGKKIYAGLDFLASFIVREKTVLIDGYAGVLWNRLREDLLEALPQQLEVNIIQTRDWLLPEKEIERLVEPYLGDEESVWGNKCDRTLADFFDKQKIVRSKPDARCAINIVLGVGAALAPWDAPVIYFDLPKNELQFRMRAGCITNLGCSRPEDSVKMYKRFYFVDWVLLNAHKKAILQRIRIIADDQRPGVPVWMEARDLEQALGVMSQNVFRVRPWFEPGAWGGQWMKKNIPGINPDEVNYAWSFELITPENGLVVEADGLMLEVSFDFLMFFYGERVLGKKGAARFGDEFPIRFDFLDTIAGGNLSIQCHPATAYIKENFGENFTQDETYYILDAEDAAGVYLGFREGIDPREFRRVLEQSNEKNIPVEVTKYVQYHPAKKHDLFLIPNGTIHSAGAGNMVLEISATPYIFTFKMYDWLRLDLNGKPRPINIGHAFHNLRFDRQGDRVQEELISKPRLINSGENWKQIHLPTHPDHFYDVHRYEFEDSVEIETAGSCHVLMLVEGKSVMVQIHNGFSHRFYYAETFVIPEAAQSYRLINEGSGEAKVVKAFLKN